MSLLQQDRFGHPVPISAFISKGLNVCWLTIPYAYTPHLNPHLKGMYLHGPGIGNKYLAFSINICWRREKKENGRENWLVKLTCEFPAKEYLLVRPRLVYWVGCRQNNSTWGSGLFLNFLHDTCLWNLYCNIFISKWHKSFQTLRVFLIKMQITLVRECTLTICLTNTLIDH